MKSLNLARIALTLTRKFKLIEFKAFVKEINSPFGRFSGLELKKV